MEPCEIIYMISCKTAAAGIDCNSGWQVLESSQVRKLKVWKKKQRFKKKKTQKIR